jgi:hypothetical protein
MDLLEEQAVSAEYYTEPNGFDINSAHSPLLETPHSRIPYHHAIPMPYPFNFEQRSMHVQSFTVHPSKPLLRGEAIPSRARTESYALHLVRQRFAALPTPQGRKAAIFSLARVYRGFQFRDITTARTRTASSTRYSRSSQATTVHRMSHRLASPAPQVRGSVILAWLTDVASSTRSVPVKQPSSLKRRRPLDEVDANIMSDHSKRRKGNTHDPEQTPRPVRRATRSRGRREEERESPQRQTRQRSSQTDTKRIHGNAHEGDDLARTPRPARLVTRGRDRREEGMESRQRLGMNGTLDLENVPQLYAQSLQSEDMQPIPSGTSETSTTSKRSSRPPSPVKKKVDLTLAQLSVGYRGPVLDPSNLPRDVRALFERLNEVSDGVGTIPREAKVNSPMIVLGLYLTPVPGLDRAERPQESLYPHAQPNRPPP